MLEDRIIVALDFSHMEDAKKMVETLGEKGKFYKVGLELFLNSKGDIIEYLKSKEKKIFFDLKFHDIPNTTAMASIFASKKGVEIFNIHTSSGKKVMSKVVEEVRKIDKTSLIIGVTILTSMDEKDVIDTFNSKYSLEELAINLAKLGKESGLDGVVCSPYEARKIKNICGEDFKTVCPGVRPKWAEGNDQSRIMTPYDAILNGCDFLVIGRPITKSKDPIKAMELIQKEVDEALKEMRNATKKL